MLNYIDWYVVELRQRLQKDFAVDRLEIIVLEVTNHLQEAAKSHAETSKIPQEQALLKAIEEFGSPQSVAMTYLSESNLRVWGMRPLTLVLLSGLAAIASWDFAWMTMHGYFDHFGETWQNGIAGFACLFSLLVFFRACRAGHRSFAKPILGLVSGTAIGLVFLMSFWIVGPNDSRQGLNRFKLGRDVDTAKRSLEKLDRLEAFLLQGSKEFEKANSAKDLGPMFRNVSLTRQFIGLPDERRPTDWVIAIPTGRVYTMVDGRLYAVDFAPTFAEAKGIWQQNASKTLEQIPRNRSSLNQLLGLASEARTGRLFFFNSDVYRGWVMWTLAFSPLLFLTNAMAFAMGSRRVAWPLRAVV